MKIINDLPPHFNSETIIISKIRSCIESKQEFRIAVYSFNSRQAKQLFTLVQDEVYFPIVNVNALKLADNNGNYVIFLPAEVREKLRGIRPSDVLLHESLVDYVYDFPTQEIITYRVKNADNPESTS